MAIEVNGYTIEPDADLTGAILTNADLTDTNLATADLFEANLTVVNLTNTNIYEDRKSHVHSSRYS